jgi:hypothetical protein
MGHEIASVFRARCRSFTVAAALLCSACSASNSRSDGGSPDLAGTADLAAAMASDLRNCPPTHVSFQGTVVTVAQMPLGLDSSVRSTPVSGSFSYDPCAAQALPNDPQRGRYPAAGIALSLSVAGHALSGSGMAYVEVEDLNPDTFRFEDGVRPLDTTIRVMTFDGQAAPKVSASIAITDASGAAFSSNALPAAFPLLNIASYPHTFSVSDPGGTLLLQLSSMTQP